MANPSPPIPFFQVPDPTAIAPSDWDEDEDGEWEAPLVPNPKCKAAGCGVWRPPIIPNPAYKVRPNIDVYNVYKYAYIYRLNSIIYV